MWGHRTGVRTLSGPAKVCPVPAVLPSSAKHILMQCPEWDSLPLQPNPSPLQSKREQDRACQTLKKQFPWLLLDTSCQIERTTWKKKTRFKKNFQRLGCQTPKIWRDFGVTEKKKENIELTILKCISEIMFSAMLSEWCDLEEEKKITSVSSYYTSSHYYTSSASPWCRDY